MVMMEGGVWRIDRPPALCLVCRHPASSAHAPNSGPDSSRNVPTAVVSVPSLVYPTKAIILISDPLNPGDSRNEVTITRARLPTLPTYMSQRISKTGHTDEVGSSGGGFSYPQFPAGLNAHLGVPEHSSGFAIPCGARVGWPVATLVCFGLPPDNVQLI